MKYFGLIVGLLMIGTVHVKAEPNAIEQKLTDFSRTQTLGDLQIVYNISGGPPSPAPGYYHKWSLYQDGSHIVCDFEFSDLNESHFLVKTYSREINPAQMQSIIVIILHENALSPEKTSEESAQDRKMVIDGNLITLKVSDGSASLERSYLNALPSRLAPLAKKFDDLGAIIAKQGAMVSTQRH